MDEKGVLDILAEHLIDRRTAEALALAYKDVGLILLTELRDPSLDEESWLTLQMINDAKSRLCFYNGLNLESGEADASADYIWGYLNILELLEEVMIFLLERYETLPFGGDLGKRWPKEAVIEMIEALKNKHSAYEDQLKMERRISLNSTEPRLLDGIFNTAYQAILGEEIWKIFMERFNRANAILRKYQTELQPSQSDRTQ